MTTKFAPDLAPDVLQNMKVIVLNLGLRINSADRIEVGLAMINIKRRNVEAEPLKPFQKGFDVFFVALFDFLRGNDSPVLIFQDKHAGFSAQREDLIEVALSNRVLSME